MNRVELERVLCPELRKLKGKTLDVGCSTSIYADLINGEYVGMDLTAIELRRKEGRTFSLATGENIPFKDRSFDNIICIETLQYVKDPERVLSELSRLTKKGGTLVVTVPTRIYSANEPMEKHHGFDVKEISSIIGLAGFSIKKIYRSGGPISQSVGFFESVIGKLLGGKGEETEARWDPTNKLTGIPMKVRGLAVSILSQIEALLMLSHITCRDITIVAKKD